MKNVVEASKAEEEKRKSAEEEEEEGVAEMRRRAMDQVRKGWKEGYLRQTSIEAHRNAVSSVFVTKDKLLSGGISVSWEAASDEGEERGGGKGEDREEEVWESDVRRGVEEKVKVNLCCLRIRWSLQVVGTCQRDAAEDPRRPHE